MEILIKGWIRTLLVVFVIGGFIGCNDDDMEPITLKDRDVTTIKIYYTNSEAEHTYTLQGGDGHYIVKTGSEDIVTAEMISSVDLRLRVAGLGKTTVTITDNSQNTLILNIEVSYEIRNHVIVKHDVIIVGDDLTENEKKAIREKCLAEIPVKVGGSYQFIFSDPLNRKGEAIICTDALSSYRIETTFEFKEIEDIDNFYPWGYEIVLDNEKRVFIIGRYYPSTRAYMIVPTALMEDVTRKIQTEYPNAELVYTLQVIKWN